MRPCVGAVHLVIHQLRALIERYGTHFFRDGAGIFYGYGNYRGVMVQLRFHWMSRGPDQARWEQAFSADEGHTWETNWIMEVSRVTEASCVSDVTSTAVVA
jgi:hypothetical protein